MAHKDIDFKKWDLAVAESINPKIYAESWYLDSTCCGRWDALILNDYEAVMPLPYNTKLFGIKQVYRPLFTQQLGVFSQTKDLDCNLFFAQIPAKFKRLHYAFNDGNIVSGCSFKTNLVLPLQDSYPVLLSNFSSSLRKRIKRSHDLVLEQSKDVNFVVDFYKTHLESKVQLGEKGYELAKTLFENAVHQNCAAVYLIKGEDETLAAGVFLKKHRRLINVFAASKNTKQHANSMSTLLAKVIEKYSNSEYVFDFEGSDIPGVKKYFESFGAIEQNYPVKQYNNLPFWLKYFRPD